MASVRNCTRACQTMTACFCSPSIRWCAHRITSRSQISRLHLSGWLSSTILIRQALGSIALCLSQSQIQHPHCHALICYSYLSCQHRRLFLTQQKHSLPQHQEPMIHHLSGPWLCEVSLLFLTASLKTSQQTGIFGGLPFMGTEAMFFKEGTSFSC